MNKNIIILGYGTVGQLEYSILSDYHNVAVFDLYKQEYNNITQEQISEVNFDLAVICVPTPTRDDGRCDLDEVARAINSVNANIYLIKSTIQPGSTYYLKEILNKEHIVFSPEHSGATPHCKNFEYNFTILGGNKEDCLAIQQIYQEVYDARHTFKIVDSTTAEISKYMLNSYLALKVSFCNLFADVCELENVNYEDLRECFILDPRISSSHTFVYKDHPYWDSHCFNKDIQVIANQYNLRLLQEMINYNEYKKISSNQEILELLKNTEDNSN